MSVKSQVIQTAITTLVSLIGQGNLFNRVKAEIIRKNNTMSHSTGVEKRSAVLADLKIIFDDVAVPVGSAVINLLIELGVQYLASSKK